MKYIAILYIKKHKPKFPSNFYHFSLDPDSESNTWIHKRVILVRTRLNVLDRDP